MAKLTDEEKSLLKKLTDKAKAPDGPGGTVNFTLDLGSDTAWERARKLGLITDDDDNADDKSDDDADDADDAPKQRGYFG